MVVEDLELLRELEQLVLTLAQPLLCEGRTSLGRSWRREKSEPRGHLSTTDGHLGLWLCQYS